MEHSRKGALSYAAVVFAIAGALFGWKAAYAAPPPAIWNTVGVCDPWSPQHCAKPDSNGALPITGSITADNASVGANGATAPTSSTSVGSVDGDGNLQAASTANPIPVNVVSGGAGGGAVYGPTAAGSAAANPPILVGGTADGTATGNVANAKVSAGLLYTAVGAALPAGSNVIGHVVTDSGSTTAVTQATASSLNATVVGAGTAGTPSGGVVSVQGVVSGTALPVSAASLPLPTGAATASNQTGGSQKTQIVDGSGNVIASTSNNLNVQCANCSGSGVSTGDEASFTAGTSLFAGSGGFYQTTATSNPLTTGQQGMFQVTANRALFSNLRNAAGTEVGTASTPLQVSLANTGSNATAVKVDASATTQPVSGTVTVQQSTAASLNATVVGTGTLAVQNTAATPAGINLIGKVGIDQTTPGTTNGVQVNAALPAGTNVIGHVIADSGSTTAVTQATASNLNATVVGTGTFATQAAPTAATTGGASNYSLIVANNTTGISIKGSAGTVYDIEGFGVAASTPVWVKLYDTSGTPTCGSGTPVWRGLITAASTGGGSVSAFHVGRAFASGVGLCVTAGIADNDTTAPAATTYTVNVGYK